jgi:hypothetical protein
MIDPFSETVISLSDAAKLLPTRRGGKKASISGIYRWTTAPGCRGVVLESIQVGGTRCTSREALSRFFTAMSAASGIRDPVGPTSSEREEAIAEAEAVCGKLNL